MTFLPAAFSHFQVNFMAFLAFDSTHPKDMISFRPSSWDRRTLRATHVEITEYAAKNLLQIICFDPRWQLTWQHDALWEILYYRSGFSSFWS